MTINQSHSNVDSLRIRLEHLKFIAILFKVKNKDFSSFVYSYFI